MVAAGLVYGVLLVFFRGRPSLDADAGIFLSVAGRLLAGDRLYADVFDNKDPLFFYVDAAALGLGGWRGPAALDAVWLALAGLSMAGLLRAIGLSQWSAAVGFVSYPLLLTGTWYFAGYSMLGALALVPLVGWLAAERRWISAGALFGVALLFKSNLGLVLLATPAALLAHGRANLSILRAVARFAAGAGVALGLGATLLALRGELRPYLGTLRENAAYSHDVLGYTGRKGGVLGHLDVVREETVHTPFLVVLFVVGGMLAAAILRRERRPAASATLQGSLAAVFLATSAATLVTLALTAAWIHHMQMLAVPGALVVVLLASLTRAVPWGTYRNTVCAVVVAVVAIWILGGFNASPDARAPRSLWWGSGGSPSADALENAADRFYSEAVDVTYARLGRDDDDAHGAFLDDRFELACPRFHQHLHTADLGAVLRCIERQRPELLLVAEGIETDPASQRWSVFVRNGRELLALRYERALRRQGHRGPIEVWKLRERSG